MGGGFVYLLVSAVSGIPVDDHEQTKTLNVLTEYVLIAYGFASFFWGLLLSKLLNNRNVYIASYCTQLALLAFLMLALLSLGLQCYPLTVLAGCLLGAIDTTNNIALSTITQIDYPREI
jgi:hypothetical protein